MPKLWFYRKGIMMMTKASINDVWIRLKKIVRESEQTDNKKQNFDEVRLSLTVIRRRRIACH